MLFLAVSYKYAYDLQLYTWYIVSTRTGEVDVKYATRTEPVPYILSYRNSYMYLYRTVPLSYIFTTYGYCSAP